VEGGRSSDHARTKALLYGDPGTWASLLDRLADSTIATLRAQVRAGAQAVQVFDSWVGALSADDYRRSVLPASAKVFAALADLGVPRIHFGVGTGHLLPLLAEAGADVVGVDWRVPLDVARCLVDGRPVQGNLDPTALLAPPDVLDERVDAVLAAADGRPGHVFNLGWGVLPATDPEALRRVVDRVHAA
jgi:uroporphyrinogen decarboxylase